MERSAMRHGPAVGVALRLRLHASYEPDLRCIARIPLQSLGPGLRQDDGMGKSGTHTDACTSAPPMRKFGAVRAPAPC